jgi:ABC-type transport system involved in Fe-S cluster assembly fused permease/ATPase subunit
MKAVLRSSLPFVNIGGRPIIVIEDGRIAEQGTHAERCVPRTLLRCTHSNSAMSWKRSMD